MRGLEKGAGGESGSEQERALLAFRESRADGKGDGGGRALYVKQVRISPLSDFKFRPLSFPAA